MNKAGLFLLITMIAAAGCSEKARPATGRAAPIRGSIVGRDVARNELTLDHEKAGDLMEAMTMPYPVQGGKVDRLPPDGTHVTAVLHEKQGSYFLTDVKAAP